jgi:hypothetical protein
MNLKGFGKINNIPNLASNIIRTNSGKNKSESI